MKRIELHSHSWYSDGTSSPADVVARANAAGVEVLFLTDHDSVSGFPEAQAASQGLNLKTYCGIEINTRESDQVHILGYGLRWQNAGFSARLTHFRERREQRIVRMIEKLKESGINISWDDIKTESRESLGRPHMADALKRKGIVKSRQEAFDRFLTRGKPGYVEPMGPTPQEAIECIREFGGFASLAHPQTVTNNAARIAEWMKLGLEGIETYYGAHTSTEIRRLKEFADTNTLLSTGGTDFHGPGTGRDGRLGVEVPDEVFAKFLERLSRCN